MMLGSCSRARGSVAVLEKHGDFLRDFRGDTVHPSTLQVMDELGLLTVPEAPHQRCAGRPAIAANGSRSPTLAPAGRVNFVAFMPQWEFLDFLAEQAASCRPSYCTCGPKRSG